MLVNVKGRDQSLMSLVVAKKSTKDKTGKTTRASVHGVGKPSQNVHSNPQTSAPQQQLICPCDGNCPRCEEGEIDLQGQSDLKPPQAIAQWIEAQECQKGLIQVRFGKVAKGEIEVEKAGDAYTITPQAIPLSHPLFSQLREIDAKLTPSLIIQAAPELTGYISLGGLGEITPNNALIGHLKRTPGLIGLAGFDLSQLPRISNRLVGGRLILGLGGEISLGNAFSGTFSLELINENVTFEGSANVDVKGLASGTLELNRSEEGLITGKAVVGLQFKNLSGSVDVAWDGQAITGAGKVGYQGEKFSGEVVLHLMERSKAEQLAAEKKAAAEEVAAPPAKKTKRKPKKDDYVVFGEGNLTFAFTDWLNGTAQAIIDPKGHLTIIGEITPQKEFELFPQKDYNKDLFKIEARASYGIPVVGNIFIYANISMDAFAKLGPAKFYNIIIKGTYSTDPKKSKDFSIQGSLNISAAAGLRLRGEGGAGLEILAHDIKAGAGINAIAAIRGYAEATPVIGYREKAKEGEDKKGEFFIRGDLEIAAQPFLGLSGDLFVEIDAPWWSPVPDKKWTWPLGGKEWPIGGNFGINALVDYVFGSGQPPALDFKPVDFSADKFMTDLFSDKAKPKSGEAEQKGTWKEKNSEDAEPPPKKGKEGDAKVGKPPKRHPTEPRVKPGGAKKRVRPAEPNIRTAEGKMVKEYQEEAAKKGKKPEITETKAKKEFSERGKVTEEIKAEKGEQEGRIKGIKVLNQALRYKEETGISFNELNAILKKIKKRKEFGFRDLYARKENKEWVIYGGMSPAEEIRRIAVILGEEAPEIKALHEIEVPVDEKGEPPSISETWEKAYGLRPIISKTWKPKWYTDPKTKTPLLDLTGFTLNVVKQFPILMNYQSPLDKQNRSNRERMQDEIGPIFKDGTTIELHHVNQDFFGDVMEMSVEYHQKHGNPHIHPFKLDPAYDSWRGLNGYYNGTIRSFDSIYNSLRRKYWRERAKG